MAMACLVEHTRAALLGKHAMPHTRLRVMPPAPRSVPGLSSEPSPASQHLAGPTSARSENIVTGGEAFIRFRPSRVSRSIPAHSCPPLREAPLSGQNSGRRPLLCSGERVHTPPCSKIPRGSGGSRLRRDIGVAVFFSDTLWSQDGTRAAPARRNAAGHGIRCVLERRHVRASEQSQRGLVKRGSRQLPNESRLHRQRFQATADDGQQPKNPHQSVIAYGGLRDSHSASGDVFQVTMAGFCQSPHASPVHRPSRSPRRRHSACQFRIRACQA